MKKTIQLSQNEVFLMIDGADGIEDEVLTFLDIQSEKIVCVQPLLIGLIEEEHIPGYADLEELEIIKAYIENPNRFVQIPPIGNSRAYAWRKTFAENLPAAYRKELLPLLDGAGAFSRFNDYLGDNSELIKSWELYEIKATEDYISSLVPSDVTIELL